MKNNKSHVSEKLFIPIVELIKLRKFNEALELLEDLSDQNSDIINRFKGSIYLNKKEWDKSLFHFKKISNESKNFKIFNNIGVSLYKLGKYSEAINEFNQAIEINNTFLSAYENLSLTYKQLGNYSLSIEFSLKALNLSPKNIKIQNNLIETFNYYKPKKSENLIINLNDKISKIDELLANNLAEKSSVSHALEKSEKILQESNLKLSYPETQIYRRNKINLNCDRHFGIFNKHKIIPKYCFSCYKVQINLKNVLDLIKLYFYFNNISLENNNIRKCMVELRKNVVGNYKGYLYAGSIEEAKNIEKKIKQDLINYQMNFERIEIKHGCTEYYKEFKLFKNVEENIIDKIYKKEWEVFEKEFDEKNFINEINKEKIFDNTLNKYNLSDFLIIKNWILYAKILNDYSYKEIFNYNVNINHMSIKDIENIKMRNTN